MKTSKTLTIYAVNRLWKKNKDDVYFTKKIITSGPYRQKKIFTITIPKNTPYEFRDYGIAEQIFKFGGIDGFKITVETDKMKMK